MAGPRIGAVVGALVIGATLSADLALPRLMAGRNARDWAFWHAHQAGLVERPLPHVREAARWAGLALRVAPLPWAAQAVEAAARSVDAVPPAQRAAARPALADLAAATDRLRPWQRSGMAGATGELRSRLSALPAEEPPTPPGDLPGPSPAASSRP